MRVLIPLAGLLLAAGLVWLFSGDGGTSPAGYDDDPLPVPGSEPGTPDMESGRTPGSSGLAGSRPPSRPGRSRPARMPRYTERFGSVIVRPRAEGGEPAPSDTMRVKLAPLGRTWHRTPVGLRDPETHAWTFQRVLVGQAQVIVEGDQVARVTKPVRVVADQTQEVDIEVETRARAHVLVTRQDGEPVETVALSLKNGEGVEQQAIWHVRLPKRYGARVRASKIEGEADIWLLALEPGDYILTVEGESRIVDERFRVEAGEDKLIEVELRE